MAVEDFSMAAEIFRLLSDPTRVGILHRLAESEDDLSVTALAEYLDKRQAAVSQHLAKLRLGRLVSTRRHGNQIFYRLANEHVSGLVFDAIRHVEHLRSGTPAHHESDLPT